MKLIITFVILLCSIFASAQTVDDYSLLPGAATTLSPGQKISITIQRTEKGITRLGAMDPSPVWTINGHDLLHLQNSDGNINFKDADFSNAIYTAPATMPKTNPAMVVVKFHPTGLPEDKSIVILQCAITIADAYKIEGDISLNSSLTGMDIRLHIDDQVRYTVLANGAGILEPVNGKGSLHVKVVNDIMVQKDGAFGKYTSPMEYDIPVLISIDHPSGSQSSPATFYLKTFSSPDNDETYTLSSGSASTPFKENFINSVMMAIFMEDAKTAVHENRQNAQDNIAWAQRMQALRSKPQSEWTEQDKKDIAQMQALQQKLGSSANTQNPFSNAALDGGTVGNNSGKLTAQNTRHQAPASTMGNGAGALNISCTFNPQSSTVLQLNKEGSDMAGVQHAKIHLTVKKEK